MSPEVTQIIIAVIGAVATILCAIISVTIGVKVSKTQKEQERRAELRRRESLLSLQMMAANTELSVATANAVLGRKNNGNVERAYDNVSKVQEEYRNFQRDVLSESIA